MKGTAWAVVTVALLVVAPGRAAAADKTHQQLLAELRMLQQQQTELQQLLGGLTDTLKTFSAKLDEQTGATRKAFADQKIQVDAVAEGVRVLREKSDDTNVRLSSMTQEIEAMHLTIASIPAAAAPTGAEPGAPPGDVPPASATGAAPVRPPTQPSATPGNISAPKMYDTAFADYAAGQFDLAIEGFQTYIKMFPKTDKADDAQLNIGNSLYGAGRNREAVAAYQAVITDYPQSDSVPVAYFKLGLTYEALKQVEQAKRAYETVVQKYPTAYEAILSKQRLDSLNRK